MSEPRDRYDAGIWDDRRDEEDRRGEDGLRDDQLERLYASTAGDDDLRGYRPIHPEATWRVWARRLFAPIVAVGFLIWKFKFVVLAIFKFKLFTVAGSMLVSIAAYAWLWGWKFAVGFVLLLLVHELGHVLEARRQGIPASAPLFIPFLGAMIAMRQLPANAWKEAQVALAGPIVGSLGAAGVWIAGEALDSDLLVALAFTGFFLNLFNLLPIVPLDGGRAAAALHPALWAVGFAGLLGLAFVAPNPILLLILVVGGLELWRRWRERNHPEGRAYYGIRPWQRVATGAVYFGLAIALVLAMSASHIERDF